jgi:threonine/homoserine/homoserine lactone efflux protein
MVKKLATLAVAAGVGYVAWLGWQQLQRENDAWAQATDPIPPRDLR